MSATPKFITVYRDPAAKCWMANIIDTNMDSTHAPTPYTLEADADTVVSAMRRLHPRALDIRAIR